MAPKKFYDQLFNWFRQSLPLNVSPHVVEISHVATKRCIQRRFLNYEPQEIYVTMFSDREMRSKKK
jgi:hypothetical protein